MADLDGILHRIHLVRGIDTSLTAWWPLIELSDAARIICSPGCEEIENADVSILDYETQLAFQHLETLCACVADPGAASSYSHAIGSLHKIYATLANPKNMSTVAITAYWLSQISHTYVLLLRERVPEALIVLAHYAVLLHRHDSYWYFEGWGRHLVSVVSDITGPVWTAHLGWPMRMVGLGDSRAGMMNIG